MGGSRKQQMVASIANRPQGGGNKKQGLPPSIGRAGWLSNFIRIQSGGYFRSIPSIPAAVQDVVSCIVGAIWKLALGNNVQKRWGANHNHNESTTAPCGSSMYAASMSPSLPSPRMPARQKKPPLRRRPLLRQPLLLEGSQQGLTSHLPIP